MLNIVYAQFRFLRSDFCFFLAHFLSFVARRANYNIAKRKYKGRAKNDRLLTSKIETNYHICQRIKIVTIQSSFLKLG